MTLRVLALFGAVVLAVAAYSLRRTTRAPNKLPAEYSPPERNGGWGGHLPSLTNTDALTIHIRSSAGERVHGLVRVIECEDGVLWAAPATVDAGCTGIVVVPSPPFAPMILRPLPRNCRETAVVVHAGAAISGVVVNQFNHALSQVLVRLRPLDQPPLLSEAMADRLQVLTDERGHFSFSGLVHATYEASISTRLRFPAPQSTRVVEAGNVSIRLIAREAPRLRLHLIDAQSGARIETPVRWTVHRSDGTAVTSEASTLETLSEYFEPTHPLTITVMPEGYLPTEQVTFPVPASLDHTARVALEPDPRARATLQLVLYDRSGTPVQSIAIERGASATNLTNRDGIYMLDLPPGDHRVTIRSPWEDFISRKPSWIPETLRVSLSPGEKTTRRAMLRMGGWLRVRAPRCDLRLLKDGEDTHADFLPPHRQGSWYVCHAVPGSYVLLGTSESSGGQCRQEKAVHVHEGKVTDVVLSFAEPPNR